VGPDDLGNLAAGRGNMRNLVHARKRFSVLTSSHCIAPTHTSVTLATGM
jgi:hypothetical protein